MKHLKKVMLIFTCIAVICGAAGCGKTNTAAENGKNGNRVNEKTNYNGTGKTVGEDVRNGADNIGNAIGNGIEDTGEAIKRGTDDLTNDRTNTYNNNTTSNGNVNNKTAAEKNKTNNTANTTDHLDGTTNQAAPDKTGTMAR